MLNPIGFYFKMMRQTVSQNFDKSKHTPALWQPLSDQAAESVSGGMSMSVGGSASGGTATINGSVSGFCNRTQKSATSSIFCHWW